MRLKEVFNRQIVNFREACYFLFGYRMDMASKATAAAGAGTAPTTFVLTPQARCPKQLRFAHGILHLTDWMVTQGSMIAHSCSCHVP